MVKFVSNILLKILMKADDGLLVSFFNKTKEKYWEKVYLNYRKKYIVDRSFRFNGTDVLFYGNGNIICEEDSYIGSFSTIQTTENTQVRIGKKTSISHNVRIYTSASETDQDFVLNNEFSKKEGDVVVGNGVWIGANTFINPGIVIEDNVVIGANSVVTKNLLENGIYGGVPARLIRMKKI